MIKLNKKAAKNTAIFLAAKKYTLNRAYKIIGISYDDFIGYLLIRKYIKAEKYGYSATAQGVEFGYVVNSRKRRALLTTKGISKVASAFAY